MADQPARLSEDDMNIISSYKRARYVLWRDYPRLFSLYRVLTFPLQLAGVCLAVYAVVNFYQDNHTINPSMYTSAQTPVKTVSLSAKTALPVIQSNTDLVMNLSESGQQNELHSGSTLALSTVAGLEETVNLTDHLHTTQQTHRTTLQPLKPQSRNQTITAENAVLHNQTVANTQTSKLYVIQIASSTNYDALLDYGRGLSQLGAMTIYPSRENQNGELHYGISTGLYASSAEAFKALESLPDSARSYNPWVRAVDDIKIGSYIERYE